MVATMSFTLGNSTKPINRYTSNEFHDWQFAALDPRFLIQDVDAWALLVTRRGDFLPVAMIELKRSFIPVDRWAPFDEDRGTYAGLLAFAKAAGVPLFVVYYVKGTPIVDETLFAVFRLDEALPEYVLEREVMSAAAFADRYPLPIIRTADVF
jgi:hypothetical protein